MFKGKALLVIDRLHTDKPRDFHWGIGIHYLTQNKEDPGGEVGEMFGCVEYDCTPAPDAAYKMKIGDRIYVLVHYEMHFSYDPYTGEHDAELYYERQRVLKRQPYNARRFRRRNYPHRE